MMALIRGGSEHTGVAANAKMKAAFGVLLFTGLWFALAQYNRSCSLERIESSSLRKSVFGGDEVGAARKQSEAAGGGSYNANQKSNSIDRLSSVLKEAMQFGQVGTPTVHLVEVAAAAADSSSPRHPFLMFVCSNCFCDICDKVRLRGYWSPVESHIFHHVLRTHGCDTEGGKKALVLDVGAHVGWFSLLAASYGCRVKSFEPNTVALRYLHLSTLINEFQQVSLFPKGVGREDSQAEYRQTDTWALNGFSKKRSLLETVDVTRLDSVVDEDVLLLKIDTEGYEANVFAGAQHLLSQHKVHHILVEVKSASMPEKRSLLHSIFTSGGFARVYNWDEVISPLNVPFDQFGLRNATIVDVTDIVRDPKSYAQLRFQDFWFCRETQLPWL